MASGTSYSRDRLTGMRRLGGVLAALLAVLAGCAFAAPPPDGSTVHQLTVDGLDRSYRLYRPADLIGQVPLVIFLDGGFGDAATAEQAYGWDAQADSGRFVVALSGRVEPGVEHRGWVLRSIGCPGRRRRRLHHGGGPGDPGASCDRPRPDLRDRDQQRRHHG